MLGGFHSSVLCYLGLSHLVSRGCGPTVRDFCPLSLYGRAAHLAEHQPDVESRPLLLQDPWSVFRRTPIPSGLGGEASGPHRMRYVDGGSVPETVMVAQAIIYHRVRGSVGDQLVALAFRCGSGF